MTIATAADPRVLRKIKGIGPAIDEMYALRARKQALEKEADKLAVEMAEISEALIAKLDAEGTLKGAGKLASVWISETDTAQIDDDVKFFAYVKKTGYFHLFQRRLSNTACVELFALKGAIPGLSKFVKRSLNLRVLSAK